MTLPADNQTRTPVENAPTGREPDLIARAVEAARAVTSDDRAWALVRLAADLRAIGRPETALHILDDAFFLPHQWVTQLAMFSSAIGAHCDLGQHLTAEVLEREVVASGEPDLKFCNAALRLYSELVKANDLEQYEIRRSHYEARVEHLKSSELVEGGVRAAA